jgi:hypothetical protein
MSSLAALKASLAPTEGAPASGRVADLKSGAVWNRVGRRFLPFADAATTELPLSRLLRLSLFQISVGMAAVLLTGTLNRVMIVELGMSASIVAAMVSLPLLFAPLRALIGYKSDTHRSVLGWKRIPYIWFGTLLQFSGLALLPFALLVMTGEGDGPAIVGQIGAAFAFLLVGAGMHTTQTAGLALATDLATEESRPRVVALLYVMLLVGMLVSAIVIGRALADFTPTKLVQIVQGAAVLTMVLNVTALWKQEARNRLAASERHERPAFREVWAVFIARPKTLRLLVAGRHGRGRVQHAGRAARAVWRADPGPVGRRHHDAHRLLGGRHARRLHLCRAPACRRRRSASPGRLWWRRRDRRLPLRDLRGAAAIPDAARGRRDLHRRWRRAVLGRHAHRGHGDLRRWPQRPGARRLGCGAGDRRRPRDRDRRVRA